LIAWDQTQPPGSDFAASSTTTTVMLPRFRQPVAPKDFAHDPAGYHDVIVVVEAVAAPAQGAGFTIQTSTDATLPMRRYDLIINPLNGSQSSLLAMSDLAIGRYNPEPTPAVTGQDWIRLVVPAGSTGAVQLTVTSSLPGGIPARFDLYDATGVNL